MRRPFPVFWTVIALMVVGGLATLVFTATSDKEQAASTAAKKAPFFADVNTTGKDLPKWDGTGSDAGVGMQVPLLSGTGIDGRSMLLDPGDGTPRLIAVVAHWCPHCQAEVPRIVDWAKQGGLPKGVEIATVSTSVQKGGVNYPPAAWFVREEWNWDVLVDDELGTAAQALGTQGFPYLVFVNGDGTVAERFSGEMEIDKLEAAIKRLEGAPQV